MVGEVVVEGQEDAADDGDAERATGLPGGVVDGRTDAGAAGRQRAHDRLGRRRRREPEPDPEQQTHRASTDEGRHDRVRGVEQHRGGGDHHPDDHDAFGPPPPHQARRVRRHHHHREGDRHGQEPGFQRRVAEDELEVLDEEEHRAVERERREGQDARRGGESRIAEHAQVDHRLGGVHLPEGERAQQHHREPEGDHDVGRQPALLGRLDDGVEQRHQREDREQRAQWVQRPVVGVARCRDEEVAEHERERADRHVHEEHRAPVEVLDQEAPEHRAERDTDTRHPRPNPDRARPFVTGERVGQDRQCRREDERGSDAHETAHDDEHLGRVGERCQTGEPAEEDQADGQRALTSELVAERAGGEQQAGEHDDVRVDDPLQIGPARTQVAHDRRQRDVEDRVVDRDDHERHAEDGQGVPATLVGLLRAEQRGAPPARVVLTV